METKTKTEMLEELKDVPMLRHSFNRMKNYPKSVVQNIYEEALRLGYIKEVRK